MHHDASERTVGEWLNAATRSLSAAGDAGPAEARQILRAVLHIESASLWAHPERRLTAEEVAQLDRLLAGRLDGMPLQYLTRSAAFRHLELTVGPGVFVPRPETEGLVDHVLAFLARGGFSDPTILELCLGSGAILAALLSERPDCRGVGVEISRLALDCARANLEAAGVSDRVRLFEGDLFAPLAGPGWAGAFQVVAANPPYIPAGLWRTLPREVRDFEPPQALLGGPDGTSVIRRIVAGSPAYLAAGGLLALEIDETHAEPVMRLLGEAGSYVETRIEPDLAGRPRYALARRGG